MGQQGHSPKGRARFGPPRKEKQEQSVTETEHHVCGAVYVQKRHWILNVVQIVDKISYNNFIEVQFKNFTLDLFEVYI